MKPNSRYRLALAALAAGCAFAGSAIAASITMTNSDASGTTSPSLTTKGNWSDGLAPNSANDYFSDAFNIRTPQVSSPSTNFFAGKSLSLDTGGALFHKYTAAANVTIPDLRLNGGTVLMAAGNGLPFTLWGAITVTASSVLDLNNTTNSPLTIYAPISGSADLKVQGASTSGNYVRLLGDNSAFSGNWNLSSGSLVIGNGGTSGSPGSGNINLASGMALTINRSGTLTVPGAISGNASLTKAGSGTLILGGYNSYSRSTTISAGTLQLDEFGMIVSSPSISVASGAIFDVSRVSGGFTLGGLGPQSLLGSGSVVGSVTSFGSCAIVPGGTNVVGTLTFSNDLALTYGDTLAFDLSSANTVGNGTNDLIVINGNLTLGDNTVVINPLGLLAGTYRLITYTGTKTGSLNPTVAGTRYTCTIDESTPGQINLVVSGSPANLVWTGQNGSSWDLQMSYNWKNAGSADVFYNGDSVSFDDAAGMTPVDLYADLAPSAISVNLSGTNTFQGPGSLMGGASLTKDGPGTLILDNAGANSFSGLTTLNAGTLQIGNYDKKGSLGTGPVVNNAALVFTRSDAVTVPNAISGTGNLSFLGSNTVTLTGHSTFTGTILTGTILKMSSEDALGDNPPTFSATQLMMGTFNSTNAALCVTNGGIQATASFTIASLNRGIAIAYANSYKPRPNFIVDAGATLTVASPISGSTLTKWGPGTLVLTGTNTFNGHLEIDSTTWDANDGAVRLTSSANVPASVGSIDILNGNAGRSVLQLDGTAGGITIPKLSWAASPGLRLGGRSALNPHLQNLAGTNTLMAPVLTLGNGATPNACLQSDTGLLVLAGGIGPAHDAAANARPNLVFMGNGDFLVSGAITNDARGSSIRFTKNGTGTLTLAATNACSGTFTNNAGTLLVTGMLGTNATLLTNILAVAGGTLAGNGIINAPVIVQNGATLSPGPGIGTFTINNALTLNSGSTTLIDVDASTGASDQVQGLPAITYGGTLVVTNWGAVTGSKTFQLFKATTSTGSFASVVLPSGAGQTWSFDPATGVLSVTSLINTTPTNVTAVVSGNTLSLSWPADHQGWQLQAQTNSTSVGLNNNWVTVPGSAGTNRVFMTLDPAQGSVFYRLVYPGQ